MKSVGSKLKEGSLVGDYAILRSLGSTSLASTYLVEHRFLKRHFVIKSLSSSLTAQKSFIDRFQTYVGPIAQLDHPHIVKIHDASRFEDFYFIVMDAVVDEHLLSTNLLQFLRSTHLQEEQLYEIFLQIAEALDYAHSKGVIHRSLKMENILVNSQSKVLVTDFGISSIIGGIQSLAHSYTDIVKAVAQGEMRQLSAEKTDNTWHTAALNALIYQAPEQRRAEENITPACDTYAFGILLYTAITGAAPEGFFILPENVEHYRLSWSELIKECVNPEPKSRPLHLSSAVKSIQKLRSSPFHENPLQPRLRQSGPRIKRPELDLHPEKAFHVDPTVKVYQPTTNSFSETEPLPTEMVIIPGGTYWRGSSDGKRDEMPRHRIILRSFALDKHPVTNEQFVRFLITMGGEKDSYHRDLIRLRDSRLKRSAGKLNIESGYQKHPVVGVTWYGAAAYARWLGRRLPTEAEWEIAASGAGKQWPFPVGENVDKSLCNYFSADTTAVDTFAANEQGLLDIAGNVYEWCYDWYDYNYYEKALQEPDNPEGPFQGVYRVLRGGCWKSLKEDLRCSRRHRNNPGAGNSTYGFRCAADVDPVQK